MGRQTWNFSEDQIKWLSGVVLHREVEIYGGGCPGTRASAGLGWRT